MPSPDPPIPRPLVPEIDGITDLERIGHGGFGRVYRGWQTDMRRPVAVKVLDGVVDDPESDRRFRREVAAMGAASHHPNVVAIYATGVTSDGHPMLVMAYLPGGTLADRIRQGPLTPAAVIDIGTKMAAALAAAHESGVLHRDVKPSNILFSAYDEPQLADFGIARLADATRTNATSVAATIAYAPPEILSGEPATTASDVYSLAATLHTALVGSPPFGHPSGEPLAASVARAVVELPPDLRNYGVPAPLAEVISRAMRKSPAERTPTAEQFRVELAAASKEAVPGPDPSLVPTAPLETDDPVQERPDRSPDRRRRGLLVASIIALLIVGAAALAFLFSRGSGGSASRGSTTTAVTQPSTTITTTAPSTSAPTTTATSAPTAPSSAPTTPRPTVPSTTTSPPPTSSPTTLPTTAASTVPQGQPASTAPGGLTPKDTVTQYYQLLDGGKIDQGFSWLTPAYQAQTGGIGGYQAFWQKIRSVQVSAIDAPSDSLARATLHFVETDGTVSDDHVELGLSRNPSTGKLLIDTYRVV